MFLTMFAAILWACVDAAEREAQLKLIISALFSYYFSTLCRLYF